MDELYNYLENIWNNVLKIQNEKDINIKFNPEHLESNVKSDWEKLEFYSKDSIFQVLEHFHEKEWEGKKIRLSLYSISNKKILKTSEIKIIFWYEKNKIPSVFPIISIWEIIQWLHLQRNFPKDWSIQFVLSDEKKEIEMDKCVIKNECLHSKHINSGVTFNLRDIVIWRKEEAWKVLLHECCHILKLDEYLLYSEENIFHWYKKFPLKPIEMFLPSEGIVEVAGGLLSSFFLFPTFSKKDDLQIANINMWKQRINVERNYTSFQLMNILSLYPTAFDYFFNIFERLDVVQPHNSEAVENKNKEIVEFDRILTYSSFFGYYIIRSCIYFHFEEWFPFFLQFFKKKLKKEQKWLKLLNKNLEDPMWYEYLKTIHEFQKKEKKNNKEKKSKMSTKMTLIPSDF